MGEVTRKELSTDEFIAKVKELTENGRLTGTSAELQWFQVQISSATERFVSPRMMEMPEAEYIEFRKRLEEVMPACDREKGYYW